MFNADMDQEMGSDNQAMEQQAAMDEQKMMDQQADMDEQKMMDQQPGMVSAADVDWNQLTNAGPSYYEGRDQYEMDIDRMVNEGLGGGQVTLHNGLIQASTTHTMDDLQKDVMETDIEEM